MDRLFRIAVTAGTTLVVVAWSVALFMASQPTVSATSLCTCIGSCYDISADHNAQDIPGQTIDSIPVTVWLQCGYDEGSGQGSCYWWVKFILWQLTPDGLEWVVVDQGTTGPNGGPNGANFVCQGPDLIEPYFQGRDSWQFLNLAPGQYCCEVEVYSSTATLPQADPCDSTNVYFNR